MLLKNKWLIILYESMFAQSTGAVDYTDYTFTKG